MLTRRIRCAAVTELAGAFCGVIVNVLFFFKQNVAYELSACLVRSEMCIRGRTTRVSNPVLYYFIVLPPVGFLFYPSDSADEYDNVDLGYRLILHHHHQ